MKWIFLSPHLDDAVFSCGGLIWEWVQAGDQVEIWTICAGDAPADELSTFAEVVHASWGIEDSIVAHRREEDQEACRVLGAQPDHWMIPDCIYRRSPAHAGWLYTSRDALFGGLDPDEKPLVEMVALMITERLTEGDQIIAPLGIGNHVDHELTRKAAHRYQGELIFYADFPYAWEEENQSLLQMMAASREWKQIPHAISSPGLEAWKTASACYRSQLGSFWEGESDLHEQLSQFSASMSGITLWGRAGGGAGS